MVVGGCRSTQPDVQGLKRDLTPPVLAITSLRMLILERELSWQGPQIVDETLMFLSVERGLSQCQKNEK